MTDAPWSRAEVESPCVRICTVHPKTGLCLGCARTPAEIADWSAMGAEARRVILADLPNRSAAPSGRQGGRNARRPG